MKNFCLLTVKIRVDFIVELAAGPEVNQLDFVCPGVDQNVLVFDIAVGDSSLVHLDDCGHDLLKDVPCEVLFQGSGIWDKVEEIFARASVVRRAADPLHDDDEAIRKLKVVDEFNDAGDVISLHHECDFGQDEPLTFAFTIRWDKYQGTIFSHTFNGNWELSIKATN